MKIIHTKINHEDDRGIIRDMIARTPMDAATIVSSTPGAVRGNHYHNHTDQYDYILSGSFICVSQNGADGVREEEKVTEGDLVFHLAGYRHAYKAVDNATLISFTCGPRQGEDYEKDVIRLEGEDKLLV